MRVGSCLMNFGFILSLISLGIFIIRFFLVVDCKALSFSFFDFLLRLS